MKDELLALAERIEGGECSVELDEKCAEALGWQQRVVTGIGTCGRTPGSYLWFPPLAARGNKGKRKPPHFTGPRNRKQTAAALRSKAKDHLGGGE